MYSPPPTSSPTTILAVSALRGLGSTSDPKSISHLLCQIVAFLPHLEMLGRPKAGTNWMEMATWAQMVSDRVALTLVVPSLTV